MQPPLLQPAMKQPAMHPPAAQTEDVALRQLGMDTAGGNLLQSACGLSPAEVSAGGTILPSRLHR